MTEISGAQIRSIIQNPGQSHPTHAPTAPGTIPTHLHIDTPRPGGEVGIRAGHIPAPSQLFASTMELYRTQHPAPLLGGQRAASDAPPAPGPQPGVGGGLPGSQRSGRSSGLHSASATQMKDYERRTRAILQASVNTGTSVSLDPLLRTRVERTHAGMAPPSPGTSDAKAPPGGWRRSVLLGWWDRLRRGGGTPRSTHPSPGPGHPPPTPNPVLQLELTQELTNLVVRVGSACFAMDEAELRQSPGLQSLLFQHTAGWNDMPDWIKLSGILALRKAGSWVFPSRSTPPPNGVPGPVPDLLAEEPAGTEGEDRSSSSRDLLLPTPGQKRPRSSSTHGTHKTKAAHIEERSPRASTKKAKKVRMETTEATETAEPTTPTASSEPMPRGESDGSIVIPLLSLPISGESSGPSSRGRPRKAGTPKSPKTPKTPKSPKKSRQRQNIPESSDPSVDVPAPPSPVADVDPFPEPCTIVDTEAEVDDPEPVSGPDLC